MGVNPPLGIYSHIIGIDIVRTSENDFFVLEDNARTPSGVSYMLENRETMMHMFPDLFAKNSGGAGRELSGALAQDAGKRARPGLDREPTIAVLTPGHYNSAYFEHSVPCRPDGRRTRRGPRSRRCRTAHLQMKTTQGYARSTSSTAASTTTSSIP